MWNKADVFHIKIQSRTLSKGAKDHETSVRISSDGTEMSKEESKNLKQEY
jgi:hypothetical protein